MDPAGRVVLVAGAAEDVGEATARTLAARGELVRLERVVATAEDRLIPASAGTARST